MELELTPDILTAFLKDFFTHLHRHLETASDIQSRIRIVREANQYLRGAHALFATTATGRQVERARDATMDGLRGLLNAMFDAAGEEIDELEEHLLLEAATTSGDPAPRPT